MVRFVSYQLVHRLGADLVKIRIKHPCRLVTNFCAAAEVCSCLAGRKIACGKLDEDLRNFELFLLVSVFPDGRRHDRKGDCVMTPQEMRANPHQCLSWSESAHYRENREAFFALARAWMSAAIRLERDNTPLETPLPTAPNWYLAAA
jgi:hypothetical protein